MIYRGYIFQYSYLMTILRRSRFKPFVGFAIVIFVIAFIAWQFLSVGRGPDAPVDSGKLIAEPPASSPIQ
ncbi:MAG: hypothetical protein K2Q26_06605 [Bdellovibrionales bacterium]|nr:hypothetical protein [Bdellovibrionales bacterium]